MLNMFLGLLAATATTQICPNDEVSFRGITSNYNYAYSVAIPQGFVGCNGAPPSPQHGFGINFAFPPGAKLWVDGSYNAVYLRDLDDAAGQYLMMALNHADGEVAFSKSQTHLGGLAAVRLSIRYRSKASSTAVVEEVILALRDVPDNCGILYSIGYTCPSRSTNSVRHVFDQMAATWQEDPLWPEDPVQDEVNPEN